MSGAKDPAAGARGLLVAANTGWTSAPDAPTPGCPAVYLGVMDDQPDLAVCCISSGGRSPEVHLAVDYPTLQVLVRGPITNGYTVSKQIAQTVKDTLLGLFSQDVNGDRWDSVSMRGDITWLGPDDKKRPMWSLNFALIVEPGDLTESNRVAL